MFAGPSIATIMKRSAVGGVASLRPQLPDATQGFALAWEACLAKSRKNASGVLLEMLRSKSRSWTCSVGNIVQNSCNDISWDRMLWVNVKIGSRNMYFGGCSHKEEHTN